jgi:hypothetical protein
LEPMPPNRQSSQRQHLDIYLQRSLTIITAETAALTGSLAPSDKMESKVAPQFFSTSAGKHYNCSA